MNVKEISDQLKELLLLEQAPIALSFVDSAPESLATFNEAVPSACSLWRVAEERAFYAPADAHYNCPIGTMTMGFDMDEELGATLQGFMEKMCGCDYLDAAEANGVPIIAKSSQGVIYGPLHNYEYQPDLILIWLDPRQAMLFSEAKGNAAWTAEPKTHAYGRPACAALPAALNHETQSLSYGCAGMRTFTEVNNDKMLAVISYANITDFMEHLQIVIRANTAMQEFYDEHKQAFSGRT